MMQHPATTVFLLGIIALTICLRVYRLADVPFGFFADEAAIGYNAYTLLTTGRDEHGEPFPVFFRSFGDYKPPIPIYVTVPFVAAFGLTELSVKLPSVTWGVLTVVLLYLLGAELGSRAIGLWAAFIGATM